ncbi:MAG TPA: GNAT family N-acyltransferase [Hyphomicrobiales bacterium]|nr:GNAT family N-acyltransferase [Hyphomicrobiales bacterium]
MNPLSLVHRVRAGTRPVPGMTSAPAALAEGDRATAALPDPLGRLGSLDIAIARTPGEIRALQRLRYRVFYDEMSAVPDARARLARRDVDAFDPICDHLVVRDNDLVEGRPGRRRAAVVGTYRLLRQEVAARHGGFYTAREYDIAPLLARHPERRFLELGRSCVRDGYRDKRTVELLWHGLWVYVLAHDRTAMIGCVSFEGTDPARLALPLSYLHHFHRSPEEWRARALPDRYVEMNRLPREAIDMKAALRALPPLVKGYLRLGATVCDGAVIDRQFGTTDIMMVLLRESINPRYVAYYGADASRHAA